VSGDSFRAIADHIYDESDISLLPLSVGLGHVVFVSTDMLDRFEREVLPFIKNPFILITHNSDDHVDERHVALADNIKIHLWFAQNVVIKHPKIVQIPIGLENRWYHNNGIVRDFIALARRLPVKKQRILYAFSVNTNKNERRPAMEALARCPVAEETVQGLNSRAYRKLLASYCFVASPPGNGIDCHRTWEALYLDTVPVIKKSPLYDGFPNLPALLVNEWSELESCSVHDLQRTYSTLPNRPCMTDYIWMPYWQKLIDDAQACCRGIAGS